MLLDTQEGLRKSGAELSGPALGGQRRLSHLLFLIPSPQLTFFAVQHINGPALSLLSPFITPAADAAARWGAALSRRGKTNGWRSRHCQRSLQVGVFRRNPTTDQFEVIPSYSSQKSLNVMCPDYYRFIVCLYIF